MLSLSVVKCMDFNYCQISPAHTLCQYAGLGRTCPAPIRRGVTNGDKNVIVSLHNKLRSQVALGQEFRGVVGSQPPAANMLEMTWDDELAVVAQRWADQCQFGHDSIRNVGRFKVGQNVYIHAHSNAGPVPWRQGIMSFYDEVKLHNSRDTQSYSFLPSTGHYTQMVWAQTGKIGCGSISWREGRFIKQFLVCNYGPSGNTLRRPIYDIGKACSRCPTGTSCSNGLCSANGGGVSFSDAAQPSIAISIPQPINRPLPFSTRRPVRPIISQTPPRVQFGFRPMTHTLQDPRPVQRPVLATEFEQFNNDISVQNLLQPVQNLLPNPPPPSFLLQQSPIRLPRPSSTRPRPQSVQRRPNNCRGMFAFMCGLLG